MAFHISIKNESSAVQPAALSALVADLAQQVIRDFGPAWGIAAEVDMGGGGWPIALRDAPGAGDPADALGYHDIDASGHPYGVVFWKPSVAAGVAWQTVASHEVLELLADPLVYSCAFIDGSPRADGTSGSLVPIEACDPVQGQSYPGVLHRSALSNFVLPAWFVPGYRGPVDHLGKLPGPLQIAGGGYAEIDRVVQATGWAQRGPAYIAQMAEQVRGGAARRVQRATQT